MDTFTVVSIVTFVGFVALAAALLLPVYSFLSREEKSTAALSDPTACNAISKSSPANDTASFESVEMPSESSGELS